MLLHTGLVVAAFMCVIEFCWALAGSRAIAGERKNVFCARVCQILHC